VDCGFRRGFDRGLGFDTTLEVLTALTIIKGEAKDERQPTTATRDLDSAEAGQSGILHDCFGSKRAN
jgi:hypothetical protein